MASRSAKQGKNKPARSLANMPVPLFASVMGVGALSSAWRWAAHLWDVSVGIANALLVIAAVMWVLIMVAYGIKIAFYSDAVKKELANPMRLPFFAAVTISALVLAAASSPVVPQAANVIWWFGAVGQLIIMLYVVSQWSKRSEIEMKHVTPVWLLPIVGNVIAAMAVPRVGNVELAWLSFGVGLLFWLGILPILLYRLLLATEPFPKIMLPSYAIMLAPPAVVYISWFQLTGDATGPVSYILYGTLWAFAILLVMEHKRLRQVPFALTYLAYTFPLAALAVVSLIMAVESGVFAYEIMAAIALLVATVVVVFVVTRIVMLAAKGKFFEPESH
ncbi:MAG: hypothetical protein GX483_02915 [Actinomycetaceae bacterium]|nr:hypothetical protein [Actinomycetaceae bacterium]